MEFEVLVLTALLASVSGIIVQQPPVTYQPYPLLQPGAVQIAESDPNVLYRYGTPNHIPYFKPQQIDGKYSTGSQYAAGYPAIHHPAEYTFASPPVRHAEPINYPVPPAPVKEDVREPPQPQQPSLLQPTYPAGGTIITYTSPEATQPGLLGVSYSPANAVSSMSFSNGYGVSYGY